MQLYQYGFCFCWEKISPPKNSNENSVKFGVVGGLVS